MSNSQARQLLEHLHRGGAFGYWWGVTGEDPDKVKTSYWWPVGKPAPIPTAEHVLFGVHPAAAIPQRGDPAKLRTTIPDIAAVNCVFADFDAKDFAGDKPATLAHIASLALADSALIDSGGGYHAYWLFRAPFMLTGNEERERARELAGGLGALRGRRQRREDLARVLRVPGTVNRKYDPPCPVQILRADYERLYNLPDLETLCKPAERPPAAPIGGNGRGPSEDAGAYWLGKALDQAAPGNRNATGFWLATQLRDAGLSASVAEGQLLAYARLVPQGSGASYYSESEALASLREAYKTPAREPARKVGATPQPAHKAAPTAASSPAAGPKSPDLARRQWPGSGGRGPGCGAGSAPDNCWGAFDRPWQRVPTGRATRPKPAILPSLGQVVGLGRLSLDDRQHGRSDQARQSNRSGNLCGGGRGRR